MARHSQGINGALLGGGGGTDAAAIQELIDAGAEPHLLPRSNSVAGVKPLPGEFPPELQPDANDLIQVKLQNGVCEYWRVDAGGNVEDTPFATVNPSPIDTELDDSSTSAVENKAIADRLLRSMNDYVGATAVFDVRKDRDRYFITGTVQNAALSIIDPTNQIIGIRNITAHVPSVLNLPITLLAGRRYRVFLNPSNLLLIYDETEDDRFADIPFYALGEGLASDSQTRKITIPADTSNGVKAGSVWFFVGKDSATYPLTVPDFSDIAVVEAQLIDPAGDFVLLGAVPEGGAGTLPTSPTLITPITDGAVLLGGKSYMANNAAAATVTISPTMAISEKIVIEDYTDNTLSNSVIVGVAADSFNGVNGPVTIDSGTGNYDIVKTAAETYLWKAVI